MDLVFHSSEDAKMHAHVKSMEEYKKLHKLSLDDPNSFWLSQAKLFRWNQLPTIDNVLSYNFDRQKGPIFIKWFADGITNICFNALDRHIESGSGDKIAFHWQGNDPKDNISITYSNLLKKVKKAAIALKSFGIKKGDCIAIYLPMALEIVVAMLACARIGAIHSVIFGGFSAPSLASRIMDAKCKLLITADGCWRGSKLIDLKANTIAALKICSQQSGFPPPPCIVLRHVTMSPDGVDMARNEPGKRPAQNLDLTFPDGQFIWWHDLMSTIPDDADCPVEWMNAEEALFILYTSGSTGKPKGVLHTLGGYMVYAATTFYYTFNYEPDDVYFCTADAGWITGHSYVVYGPLVNGATSVLFEGIPTWPDFGRFWQVVEKYKVTKFYTAPTAIRSLMAAGNEFVKCYKLDSLKILGSVGEPINPSAWEWYYDVVGGGRCSIVDTFWQTETGGHMITPLPGVTPMKPGCATKPFFGVDAHILDERGKDLTVNGKSHQKTIDGYLVFGKPWPGIMRTIFGDHKRFEDVYFSKFPGYYVAGDGAKMDEDGDIWITGRIDDMLNMSGHLISTSEVESILLQHPHVAEAAVVGKPDAIKGECLHCFIVLNQTNTTNGHCNPLEPPVCRTPSFGEVDEKLRSELCQLTRRNIGPFVYPDHITEVRSLPKTRSGKVLRRLLRKVANADTDFGDLSTLADQSCLDDLIRSIQQ